MFSRSVFRPLGWIPVFLAAFACTLRGQGPADAMDNSVTLPTEASAPSAKEEKKRLPPEHDVSRIGQRNVGHGIDLYSLEREHAMGEALSAEVDRQSRLVREPEIVEYVNRLAQKLGRNSDADVLITVKVIDSLDVNIFSLPGGFLYVDKGLVLELDNEAELASMMAHEIAHVAARHATRLLTRRYAWDVLSVPLAYLGGPVGYDLQKLTAPLFFGKLSRNAEREADLLGMQYQYAAGYDPTAFVDALEKLHGIEKRRQSIYARAPLYKQFMKMPMRAFLMNAMAKHPSTENRISALQKEIATLLPPNQEYVLDTSDFDEVKERLDWEGRPVLRRGTSKDGSGDQKNRPTLRVGGMQIPHATSLTSSARP